MGTRLYVGNLSYNVTEPELRDVFAEGGRNVVEVKIVMDRDTGRPRGFAFVEMGSDDEASQRDPVADRARDPGPRDQRQRGARARAPRGAAAAAATAAVAAAATAAAAAVRRRRRRRRSAAAAAAAARRRRRRRPRRRRRRPSRRLVRPRPIAPRRLVARG